MKTWAILAAALTAAAAVTVAAPVPQAGDRAADRWEYGEVTFTPARAVRPALAIVGNAPAPAPAPAAAGAAKAAWVTGEEEVEAASWEELAAKLKLPEGPKSDNPSVHKMRVLNYLGGRGWEMVSATQPVSPLATTVTTFTFKRKVK